MYVLSTFPPPQYFLSLVVTMTSMLLLLSSLLAAEASYVSNQQRCSKVPREVCSEVQVPETNFLTERQCSAVPTTRQECSTKQEQQCSNLPETKCFDEPRTITEIQQVQECSTVNERKCSQTFEQKCEIIQDR